MVTVEGIAGSRLSILRGSFLTGSRPGTRRSSSWPKSDKQSTWSSVVVGKARASLTKSLSHGACAGKNNPRTAMRPAID